jgi:hypothetical protein
MDTKVVSPLNGVIQGYHGLAVVDDCAQIVVHAEARASGYEARLLAAKEPRKHKRFSLRDFFCDESKELCICPAGHRLYRRGTNMLFNGYRVTLFKAPVTACRDCPESSVPTSSRAHSSETDLRRQRS